MSLYWILALTVTLLPCLTAYPTSSPSEIVYKEIEILIKNLKENGCAEVDSRFYSPSGTENYTIKALDCSILELEKVRTECFDKNFRNAQLVRKLRNMIQDMLNDLHITLEANPNNCFCGQETLEEKPLNEFLSNIMKLLQMLNSSRNPKKA